MERHFKEFVVLKNIYARSSIYIGKPLAVEQEIIRVEILGDIYKWKDYRFHISWLQEWERLGLIEEILPNEKPISLPESDSILDYEKRYNIHEAVYLMKNHDVTMIDSHFKIEWKFKDGYRTLLGARSNTEIDYFFDESFGVFDLLDLTFTLVKPIEEAKEKWIEIETHKDLCTSIVNKKMIRFDDDIINPSKEFNDKQIETLFKAFARGIFKIEYLQE